MTGSNDKMGVSAKAVLKLLNAARSHAYAYATPSV